MGFSGKGEISANQKSPVDMYNKESADKGGRKAEKKAGRNISFPAGGGIGERVQGEDHYPGNPWERRTEAVILGTFLPS